MSQCEKEILDEIKLLRNEVSELKEKNNINAGLKRFEAQVQDDGWIQVTLTPCEYVEVAEGIEAEHQKVQVDNSSLRDVDVHFGEDSAGKTNGKKTVRK